MRVTAEKMRYKFHEYVPLWIEKYNIKNLIIKANHYTETVDFYDNNGKHIAYISILYWNLGSSIDNNTINLYDSKWKNYFSNMLNDWKNYYKYPIDLKIKLVNEYESI